MPVNLVKGGVNKRNLQEYKEKLLEEIQYYDRRIVEVRENAKKNKSFEDDCSSDSDLDLPQLLDSGPPMEQLKKEQAMLRTCLNASQELTGLELLQHEINLLTQPPVQGKPIIEEGMWREVTAECCVDLVPFSITFYTFRANREFAPLQFRNLRVVPLKVAHETELTKSVLPGLERPSDAVEVIRSYASALRSRRSTLARLADRFGDALTMQPRPNGGYLLKCGDMLEVSWTLQNKWSPIAPFHHRMKFDLEYIEEQYLKIIKQAHKQISEPTIDTDERTLLLAKIITTCLEAHPLETTDEETGKVASRRTTLDREPEEPLAKTSKDSEVMAPPTSIPKKMKSKSSDNTKNIQKPTKRPAQDGNDADKAKKIRASAETANNNEKSANETGKTIKSVASEKNAQKNDKNVTKKLGDKKNAQESEETTKKAEDSNKNEQNVVKSTKIVNKDKSSKAVQEKDDGDDENAQKGVKKATKPSVANKINENKSKKPTASGNTEQTKNIADKNDKVNNLEKRKGVTSAKSANTTEKVTSKASSSNLNKKNVKAAEINPKINEKTNKVANKETTGKVVKTTNENGEGTKKVVKKVVTDKTKVATKTADGDKNVKDKNNADKNDENDKNKLKNVTNINSNSEKSKNSQNTVKNTNLNTEKAKKPLNEQNAKVSKPTNIPAYSTKVLPKPKTTNPTTTNVKNIASNTEKENSLQNKAKNSKIPQKKSTTPKGVIKKMPIRVSPRKALKPETPLAAVNIKKTVRKTVTGIPRLMTKPKPKT